jgi:hypothetical protein
MIRDQLFLISRLGCAIAVYLTILPTCAKNNDPSSSLNTKLKMWSCDYDSLACAVGNWLKSDSVFILTGEALSTEIWLVLPEDMNIDSVPWPDSFAQLPNHIGSLYRFDFSIRPKIVNDTNNEEDNQESEVAYPCLFKAFRWNNGWMIIDSTVVGSRLEERCFKRRILKRQLRILSGECQ